MSEERIGKYEVLDKIAEGGFGVVYKARDPFIKRIVAIKTCPIHDDEVRHRFFREARIVGGFDHPNVTIVHDFGLEGDRAFLVQEYLPGEDLAEKIRSRAPLSLKRKVGFLIQAARGLAYAHSKGVIHRDIKPANLRVLETDQLKILDFGIAKLAASGTHLTQKGVAVGTIGYLSPEQLRELPLDARTDIFSFGVTAYELVTYRKPFRGRDISSVMRSILEHEPEALSGLAPGVPESLVQVIDRCLEKDRDRRYSSFDAVISDLERIGTSLREEDERTMTAPLPVQGPDDEDPAEAETGEHPTTAVDTISADAVSSASAATRDTHPVATTEEGSREASETTPDTPPTGSTTPTREVEATGHESPSDSVATGTDSPTDEPDSSQRLRAVLGIGLLVALVVAGGLLIAWYFYARGSDEPVAAALPGPTGTTSEEPPSAAPLESGTLLVDARPWGEIVSVLDDEGTEIPGFAGRSTPIRLQLEPGFYSVVVTHPALEEPGVCQAEVTTDATARCELVTAEVETSDYFRDMGWWR